MSIDILAHALGWPKWFLSIVIAAAVYYIAEGVVIAIRGAIRMNREEKTIPQDRDRNWQQQDGRDVINNAKRGKLPPSNPKDRK